MIKKMIIKLLEKLNWIPKLEIKNQPCYDKYGRFIGWFSRSMASAIFVFCKDGNGDWCVLASERGIEAADYQGYWNCVCGYLDYNETTKEAAKRELKEECGVDIPIESIKFIGYEDNPITSNRQNVTFRFTARIDDKITSDFTFSKDGNEGKEVGDIKWVPLNDISHYQWAFGHDKIISRLVYGEEILK